MSLDSHIEVNSPLLISSLLPLFPDNSKYVAMIRDSMDVVKPAVDSLNPGQIPVIAMGQPLFAVAKQIHWNWLDIYGDKCFVVMVVVFKLKWVSSKCLVNGLMGVVRYMFQQKRKLHHLEKLNNLLKLQM